ncbi:MAG: hypothetical protein H6Q14_1432 [Bacteroidetes bacterium]|nr:hypothetical protein [Bacteroidota bacterium]
MPAIFYIHPVKADSRISSLPTNGSILADEVQVEKATAI